MAGHEDSSDYRRRRQKYRPESSCMPQCCRGVERAVSTGYDNRPETSGGWPSTPRKLEADYNRRIKLFDDVVTKIKGIRQPEPRKRLFPSPTFEEMRWLQSNKLETSDVNYVTGSIGGKNRARSGNEVYREQAEPADLQVTRSRNNHELRHEYNDTHTHRRNPHRDSEVFVETVSNNLRSARKSIHVLRRQIRDIDTRPPSALHQTYTQKTEAIPDWFRELFADGPATFKLRPTFDADVAKTSDECMDMMEAEFTITVSPMDDLDRDCHVFVTEMLRFPYSGTLSRQPFDNFIQSQWREPCNFNTKGTCSFCPKRISVSGVAENAVYTYLAGNDSRDLRLGHGRVFRLVFIEDEDSGAVRGIYRRQMTTQPYFLTWGLVEDCVDD